MPRIVANYWLAALLFGATLFALSGWGTPPPKTLPRAAAQLQADLKLQEAPAIRETLPKSIRFAAPASWWSLIEPPQVDYRGRNSVVFRWTPQQVEWLWTGELCLRNPEAKNYRRHIGVKLSALGFAETVAKLTSSLAMLGIYNSDRFCFSKVSNLIREEVVFDVSPFTGGSDSGFQVGGRCNWSSAIACQVPAPTLRELVTAMPMLRPPHMLPEWESILNDQPVYEVQSDFFLNYSPRVKPPTSWSVTIAASNQPLLEATLQAAGFTKDPPRPTDIDRRDRDGNKLGHQSWSRNSDAWFIHFDTTSATPDLVRFRVQSPQRKP